MNQNLKDVYIKFHNSRRIFIEEETEKVFQEMVADNWSDSSCTRMEALFVVMRKRNEQIDFEEFAKFLIEECFYACIGDGYIQESVYRDRLNNYFGTNI